MAVLNLYRATGALILLSADASFRNQQLETLREVLRPAEPVKRWESLEVDAL
jgi:hypothetical protein